MSENGRYGLRCFREGVEVALAQLSGGGRLRVSSDGKEWWERRRAGSGWEPFPADRGQTWPSAEAAAAVAARLNLA